MRRRIVRQRHESGHDGTENANEVSDRERKAQENPCGNGVEAKENASYL